MLCLWENKQTKTYSPFFLKHKQKLSAQELKQLEEKQINSFEQSKKEREQRAKANNLHHPEVSAYFSSLRTAVRT